MKPLRRVFLLSILIALPCISNAQEIGLSGENRFSRQLDSFLWNYDTRFQRETQGYSVFFFNNFNSRLYLFEGQARNVQDENHARLFFNGWLRDDIGFSGEARSYRFSNTNVKQDHFLAGPAYRYNDFISAQALIGFMRDERSGIADDGIMAGLRAETAPFKAGDFTLQANVYSDYADISPRTFQTYRVQTEAAFEMENFSMDASLRLGRSIRDSYQASSFFNRQSTDFVESVQTDTSGVFLTAYFPMFDVLQSRLDINLLNNTRMVTNVRLRDDVEQTLFDTRLFRQSMDIRFQTVYPYRNSRFSGGLQYSVGTREARLINTGGLSEEQIRRRNEILQNSNFDQTRIELFTQNSIAIGERNLTRVFASISILNYDTPGTNRDDRDELFYQLRLANEHRFSDHFRSRITVAGEYTHYVYLFAERSIENNKRRSVRLIPEFEWEPFSWLSIRQQFLVRANYTVEDFELPGRPKNDQASREFGIANHADISLNPEWQVHVSASRSELRIGRLLWKEFREIPTDTLITYDSRLMVSHRSGSLITAAGIRHNLKIDYLSRATIVAEGVSADGTAVQLTRIAPGQQRTVQWGPVVEMRLPLYSRNELIINGWYQMQAIRQRLYTEFPEEFKPLFESAQRQVRRRTYPNLEIIARFRF